LGITRGDKLNLTQFFADSLHAPLVNYRWSWGARRENSDVIFLRVWDDQIQGSGESRQALVLGSGWHAEKLGYTEREGHIAALKSGAEGYAVVCTATQPEIVSPRNIKSFNHETLLILGSIVERADGTLAEVIGRVPVSYFEQTNYSDQTTVADIRQALASQNSPTTREMLANARIGQGRFRINVLSAWGGRCCVTGTRTLDAIRASHIKPWSCSTDTERLDTNNGLPLIATLDALFEVGLISFADDGELLISAKVSSQERAILGLSHACMIQTPPAEVQAYLRHHREVRFADNV